jgi:16S rRNA C967 or C1407 C5-methylase (RsmB/RsmF family)
MSTLYTGSAVVLGEFLQAKTPLTSLVYSSTAIPDKQKKAAYALLMGTLRYKSALEAVLESSNFMRLDRRMNRALVLLMLYDLLLSERKAIMGGGTVKKLMMAHENHMRTALVRLKIARGAAADEDLLPHEIRYTARLPRYARINTLRATPAAVHDVLAKEGYSLAKTKFTNNSDGQCWAATGTVAGADSGDAADAQRRVYYLDAHVPNLLVFAPGTDLHDHSLLQSGQIILQDKASCMPAAALDPANPAYGLDQADQPWHVLDGCAAPGNKTTHLLAIALEHLRIQMPAAAAGTAITAAASKGAAAASSAVAAAAAASPAAAAPAASSKQHAHQGKQRHRAGGGGGGGGEADEFDADMPVGRSQGGGGGGGRPQPTGKQVTFRLGDPRQPVRFKLEAFEVDPARFNLLHKMMARALPTPFTSSHPTPSFGHASASDSGVVCPPCPAAEVVLHNRSFLDLDPSDKRFRSVRAVLLDPTCSGSGMMHRIEMFYKHRVAEEEQRAGGKGKSGGAGKAHPHSARAVGAAASASATAASSSSSSGGSSGGADWRKAEVIENVAALADFQTEIVSHALRLPALQLLSYSTCSVHAEEDEEVVARCLASAPGKSFAVAPALPSWQRRGQPFRSGLSEQQAACCVRVAGAEDGMNGFFVAKFMRKDPLSASVSSSAGKPAAVVSAVATAAPESSQQLSGKKHARDAVAAASDEHAEEEGVENADGQASEVEEDDGDAKKDPAVGSQSKKNKKKREKAKLKRQKLLAETAPAAKP